MPTETKESIKLRVEAAKQITVNRALLEKDYDKNLNRVNKWEEMEKEFYNQSKFGDPNERSKYMRMATDAGELRDLAEKIQDSAKKEIKLIQELNLTDDNKKLAGLLKAIEAQGDETDDYYDKFTKKKDRTGKELKELFKGPKDSFKDKAANKIKDAVNPDKGKLNTLKRIVQIGKTVREYMNERTDLPNK